MSDFTQKTPFLRLLIPVIMSILVHAFLPELCLHWLIGVAGIGIMIFSFFVEKKKQFYYRWVFGLGVWTFLFYLTEFSYQQHQRQTQFSFPETEISYLGTVTDIPEIKPRSIALNVKTSYPVQKKIILYLQQTDEARLLQPGDEIAFTTTIQPFKNFGNPDDFDYEKFMKTKGFTGSAYIPERNWQATGRENISFYITGQRFRAKALTFYQSFELNSDAYAFISALTLGYKAYLTEDIEEAFRASGTAHVLAVSGLHVGIIYILINLLFSFLGKSGKRFIIRQLLVISVLWAYVFVTGMSISVIRAAIMLTLFCVGTIFKRSGFTYNTLSAAAFLILIFRPFSMFEVGFQMSFGSVLAILFFQPKLKSLFSFKTKIGNYVYDLFTVSVAAQIGIFPLVLYYFGTFPTYFFITNLLIVPMVGLIIYSLIPVALITALLGTNIGFIDLLHTVFHWILTTLIEILLRIVYIFETLPLAQLSDKYITFTQLILVFISIVSFTRFLSTKQSQKLIVALATIFAILITKFHVITHQPEPSLVIFNKPGTSEVGLFVNNKREVLQLSNNGFIPHPTKSILRLSDDVFQNLTAQNTFPVDILILSQDKNFRMSNLLQFIQPELVVIDSSLPRYAATKMTNDCAKMNIEVHDVAQSGAFSISF